MRNLINTQQQCNTLNITSNTITHRKIIKAQKHKHKHKTTNTTNNNNRAKKGNNNKIR